MSSRMTGHIAARQGSAPNPPYSLFGVTWRLQPYTSISCLSLFSGAQTRVIWRANRLGPCPFNPLDSGQTRTLDFTGDCVVLSTRPWLTWWHGLNWRRLIAMTSCTEPTRMPRPHFAAVTPAQHTALRRLRQDATLSPAERDRVEVILRSQQGESLRGWLRIWSTTTRRCAGGCRRGGPRGWTLCVIAPLGRPQTTPGGSR